ncbi:hypothetical protein NM688_g5050 [Phlebia brevispora]|uniref:Uncharacterized protein n=1 Tax=Phlebia brevispora TaxID=194682 RepID=A0ACC1T163_9APHY|nr:hypothetical protein NM688_g5050 [Phlebia brevispora]
MKSGNRKGRKCTSANSSRKAAAHAATAKKFKLPKGRVSKSRLLELTAQLDTEMAELQAYNPQVQPVELSPTSRVEEGTQTKHSVAKRPQRLKRRCQDALALHTEQTFHATLTAIVYAPV